MLLYLLNLNAWFYIYSCQMSFGFIEHILWTVKCIYIYILLLLLFLLLPHIEQPPTPLHDLQMHLHGIKFCPHPKLTPFYPSKTVAQYIPFLTRDETYYNHYHQKICWTSHFNLKQNCHQRWKTNLSLFHCRCYTLGEIQEFGGK